MLAVDPTTFGSVSFVLSACRMAAAASAKKVASAAVMSMEPSPEPGGASGSGLKTGPELEAAAAC
eukprot:600385-Heterocapsa_arctica.AAC.1